MNPYDDDRGDGADDAYDAACDRADSELKTMKEDGTYAAWRASGLPIGEHRRRQAEDEHDAAVAAGAADGATAEPCSCNGSLSCGCPPDVRAFMTGPVPPPHEPRDDWPVHRPTAWDAPIPGDHWYAGCEPGGDYDPELRTYTGTGPRVRPDGVCEGCGERACPFCGREACPDHRFYRAPLGELVARLEAELGPDPQEVGATDEDDYGDLLLEAAAELGIDVENDDWQRLQDAAEQSDERSMEAWLVDVARRLTTT